MAHRVPGLWQCENQVVLSSCHVPWSWLHRIICLKAGMGTLSTHFTDKETDIQGDTTRGQAAFSDSVSLATKA